MKKFFLIVVILILVGGGCNVKSSQTTNNQNPKPTTKIISVSSTAEQTKTTYDKRAANAIHYMSDKKFVAFIQSIQPSECKGTTPNVSYIIESDLTGDDKKELVIDATSCQAYSSGSDMNLVAQVDGNGKYSALKIDDRILVGYYSGLEVQNNILIKESAVHNPGDSLAGPTGGVDLVYFKWNGSEFVTDKTAHVSTWLSPQE